MSDRPIVPADVADVGVIATVLAMVADGQKVDAESYTALWETIEKLAGQLIEAGVPFDAEVV